MTVAESKLLADHAFAIGALASFLAIGLCGAFFSLRDWWRWRRDAPKPVK